ncbi:hypothetical protein N9A45_00550 [bacterium]|nr:hypothetical protein [bacterium]
MGLLDNGKGVTLRVVYLNVLYGVMTLLSALILAALNAPVGDDEEPRYLKCKLVGATSEGECVALVAESDEEVQNQQLFNITLASLIISGGLFAWSLLNHGHLDKKGCGAELHFRLEPLFSVIQLGLFVGLVGWFGMNEQTDAEYEANLENNVFYSDYDSRAIAIVGLIGGILDLVGFNALNQLVFKGRCDMSALTN